MTPNNVDPNLKPESPTIYPPIESSQSLAPDHYLEALCKAELLGIEIERLVFFVAIGVYRSKVAFIKGRQIIFIFSIIRNFLDILRDNGCQVLV